MAKLTPTATTSRAWSTTTCARRVAKLRELTGLSVDQIARALGVTRLTLYRWCGSGKRASVIPFPAQALVAKWIKDNEATLAKR